MSETVLFEKGYTTCSVPNPYDKSISNTKKDAILDHHEWDILLEKNTYVLQNVTAMGNSLQEFFNFKME